MFSPAKIDLINEESSFLDFQSTGRVIPIHLNSGETASQDSPDITSESKITVTEFCQKHGITSDQFLALRRKAARKHQGIDFKPVREGSRTFYVVNSAILTQMIDEGAIETKKETKQASEAIDGEIVDTQALSDGSALVVRKQSHGLALPSLESPRTREVILIDVSDITEKTEALRADQKAVNEVQELTELASHANKIAQKKAKFDLVEALIFQGYSQEQAIKIASGNV